MNHLQFVLLTFGDGAVGVMQLMRYPNLPPSATLLGFDHDTGERSMSDEVIVDEIQRTFAQDVASWRRIEPRDLPTDRTFRGAWRDSGQHIYHDMPTCRELHRNRLRAARAPLLQQLDVEYQRALEDNNVKYRNQVVAKKKKLRDATDDPRIVSASTPEELKAIWPLTE